jgi:hypothetical protein
VNKSDADLLTKLHDNVNYAEVGMLRVLVIRNTFRVWQ